MIFDFDYNNRYEKPMIIVCNPDFEELETVSYSQELKITPRFNAISELTFKIPEQYNDNVSKTMIKTPAYELIKKNRLIYVVGFGYFLIINAGVYSNGINDYKLITAYSYEYNLNKKNMNLVDGVYKFYDEINPEGTILHKIVSLNPTWTIGHVDNELWNRYRTFNNVDGKVKVYSFMANDIEEAYDCIIDFNVDDLTINAYVPNNSVKDTDIVLKFDSVVKNIQIEDDDLGIKTALAVYGDNQFSINNVNPLGTPFIYNFDYYKNTEWMNQNLIDTINAWENKINEYKQEYSDVLVNLKNKNSELIILNGQLVDLQSELKALEQLRTAQYPDVLSETSRKINQKNNEISNKESEISSKNNEINIIAENLKEINSLLSFENNFTEEQLLELDKFIDEDSYSNDNYSVTDIMNNVDIMQLSQELYEAGQRHLELVSQPNCTYKMDSVNFLFIKEYQDYTDQLKLGSLIYVQNKNGIWYSPILLEMQIDFDNPENFTMTFGNRYRISNTEWTVSELMGDVKSVSSSVQGNTSLWTNGGKTADKVNEYMKSSLNAANQEIINSKSQTVTLGDYGLRCRELLEDGSYNPQQLWINKGLIAMTDNNWLTSKLAIGNINGVYSVNAEVIAGNLIAGNQLKISSEDSSFIIDANGTTIKNADITMIAKNNRSKMILSPINGIKIQTSLNGTVWDNKFYIDPINNKLIFKGDAKLDSGTIGGWTINSNGISDNRGNYINSDGTMRIGILEVDGSSGRFDGKIYADNLDDYGITSRKLDSDSITTSKIENDAVTPSKLDRVYADYGDFRSLRSDVAHVENLVASKASISSLNALSATVRDLKADMITTDWLESNVIHVRGISGSFYPNFISWDGRSVKTIEIQDVKGKRHAVLGLY